MMTAQCGLPGERIQLGTAYQSYREPLDMLSSNEITVLKSFRKFYMEPGEMLCFNGVDLVAKTPALDSLVGKRLLVRERFVGGFSLTRNGYAEMRSST